VSAQAKGRRFKRKVPAWGGRLYLGARIGALHDALGLWFCEFERDGERYRTYHGDRAEARAAARIIREKPRGR